MIDLHCHILPGIDDGAADIDVSLEMARMFVDDGVSVVAATPHILPGLYANTGTQIRDAVASLQETLNQYDIPLRLVSGADNHIVPNFATELRSGHLLSLGDSRYALVEPPHHVPPPRMEELFFNIQVAGYVPILTHPERLTWIKSHYDTIARLSSGGVLMQITASSLAGDFGRGVRYWAERMLAEGYAHILATDAHDTDRRPPNLGVGRDFAARSVGTEEANKMVFSRPYAILSNQAPGGIFDRSSEALPPGMVYTKSNVNTGTRDGGSTGSFRGDLGTADHSVAGRLRRLFK
jgi:protein-tyrosine phosphatase